ncbi:MAG: 5-formyltetrahydrofolate cyclo-ligase [Pseudomonadota bacterium]
MDTSKTILRTTLKLALAQLDPAVKAQWDAAMSAQVVAWWHIARPPVLAVFWPLPGEPDLSPAFAQLAEYGVQLALPVVIERHQALAFAEWVPGEAMLADRMGVAVPAERRMMARPPSLLIPCLGFNAQRYRLGYGGGFYDRTLEQQPRPLTVGVAYACQLVQFVSAAHDVALDLIITEA